MRRLLLFCLFLVLALAACGDDGDSKEPSNETGGALGLFDWDRSPETIIVRLDSQPTDPDPAYLLNSIPPCTLWGDGHVIWTTYDNNGMEEVLEARVEDDAKIRAFLEDIISRGFYEWEDELIPPSTTNPLIESVTVALYNEVHTVRRFSYWPQNAYAVIQQNCATLSDTPVRVLPAAGWVSAYAVEPESSMTTTWYWPPNAPFTLAELAQNGESRWLEGSLATEVWRSARQTHGGANVQERTGGIYHVAIVVPGFSRDAVQPPSGGS